jgi:hypothetical protein
MAVYSYFPWLHLPRKLSWSFQIHNFIFFVLVQYFSYIYLYYWIVSLKCLHSTCKQITNKNEYCIEFHIDIHQLHIQLSYVFFTKHRYTPLNQRTQRHENKWTVGKHIFPKNLKYNPRERNYSRVLKIFLEKKKALGKPVDSSSAWGRPQGPPLL